MADTRTTTSTNNNQLQGYFVDKALITLMAETPLYDVAAKTPLPKGTGVTVTWNAWNLQADVSGAITEGVNQDSIALSSRKVTATVAQYQRVVKETNLAAYAYILDSDAGAQAMLRELGKRTLEMVCHTGIYKSTYYTQNQSTTVLLSAMMSGVASSFCANTGTNTNSNKQFGFPAVLATSCGRLSAVSKTAASVSAQPSLYGIRKAVNRLERKNAMPFADGYFFGYAHPNFIHGIRKDPSWLAWNAYTNSKETMYTREVGRTWGVRWTMSTLAPRYAVAAHSVNIAFIAGQQAFGVTELDGGLQMYKVTGADKSDVGNLLTAYSFVLTAAAAVLNPSAGVLLFAHELL